MGGMVNPHPGVDTFGLDASEYPLSNQQWIALYVEKQKAIYPERCNNYRLGYGVCCKQTIGRPRHHDGSHSYIRIPPNPTTRQDTDMTRLDIARSELADIERQEDALLQRKERLLQRVERIEKRPKEPDGSGDVVQFKVQFVFTDVVYKFAAIHVHGSGWYTTSKNYRGPHTWDGLLDLIERDTSVKAGARAEVFVAQSWKRFSW